MRSKQFEYTYNDAFIFNVKKVELVHHTNMNTNRARHCMTFAEDPNDSYNKLVIVIGGIYITYHKDLFLKKTTASYHNTANVEFYSLSTKTFERYNAKLCLPRHSASACYLNNYTYVIGGHTV